MAGPCDAAGTRGADRAPLGQAERVVYLVSGEPRRREREEPGAAVDRASALRLIGRNTAADRPPFILRHTRITDEYLYLGALHRLRRPDRCMPENRLHVRHVAALRAMERPDAELPRATNLMVELHRAPFKSNDQHQPAPYERA